MSNNLVSALHNEERSILDELRASVPFQRLESIHRLLSLYDAQPLSAISFDGAAAGPERGAAPVIHLSPPMGMPPAPMPGPTAAEHPIGGAPPVPNAFPPASNAPPEATGVISSVRAVLLGIGKP